MCQYYLLSYVNIHRLVVQKKKKKRTCLSTPRVQSLSVDPLVIYTFVSSGESYHA